MDVEERRRREAIAEVAAGIAHKLRNPLFGISSAAQLLRFRSQQDPVVERNVGRILREVEQLNAMVADLLEYGRPRPLSLAPHDPDTIWDEVLHGNRGLLEGHSLTLRRTRASVPVRCAVDAERLAQLFVNLLTNAVEAAPSGSEITLTTSAAQDGWHCALQNGGPAIAPELLPRVFDIFATGKPGRTGIGLALCRRIVDEHGGRITLDSSMTEGTRVVVMLPGAAKQ
ncbi:MAG: ATP-binding protein [Gemmatimonadota bacterium]|nr:ATP-binding protein [Gemmatimonadota bacterium]